MLWINLFHLYQPANSDAHVIKEAAEKSYYRIVRALEEHPRARFTLNINGCLVMRLEELGYADLFRRLKALMGQGRVELTGSAAYHPILPLIPEKEIRKQVEENEYWLKRHFGEGFKPRGFFMPELAYSPGAARIVAKLGYEWLVLDEIAVSGRLGKADLARPYRDANSGLKVVLRSRKLSRSYVPETIQNALEKQSGPETAVTVCDGELVGLRHNDPRAVFERLLDGQGLEMSVISDWIGRFPELEEKALLAASWETTEAEMKKNEPFNLWQEKTNTIQKKTWELARLAYTAIEGNGDDPNQEWARWHLKRGLASCTFWWASAKDFRLFSSLSWSPDEIERGVNELVRSVRALEKEGTRDVKVKAEKLSIAIKKMIWERHWVYYWKKIK